LSWLRLRDFVRGHDLDVFERQAASRHVKRVGHLRHRIWRRIGYRGSNGILTPTIAFPDPFAGFGPASTLNPATISYTTVNPNLKLTMVQEYNLTLERQWRD
jgi:hypothetical protein